MFREIEDIWTQDAGEYDELIQAQLASKKDVMHWNQELREVLGEEKLRILDVGCGPGFLSILLARMGHQVRAIDGSSGMVRCAIANCKRAGVSVQVLEEDGVELPLEEAETYDVILSRDVVWTLYDPARAFARWRDVLSPGGKILFYDGDYQRRMNSLKVAVWKRFSWLLILLTERKVIQDGTESGAFCDLPLVAAKRPREDLRLLRQAGFHKIRITNDRFRNSLRRMEYWKYGYQGRKFRVIAWKK